MKNICRQKHGRPTSDDTSIQKAVSEPENFEAYETMSKDELIQELIKARIAEARLKKVTKWKGMVQ